MRKTRALGCALIAALLSACATFSYNNQTYHSASDALAAQEALHQSWLRDVATQSNRLSGKAIVITPSKSTCEALGITRRGAPAHEFVDYLGTTLERDYSFFGQVLERAQLFSGVETRVVEHPQADARSPEMRSGYTATVYLALVSPTQVGWYMLLPGSEEPIQVDFDHMAAPGAPRLNSWVAAVARNVNQKAVK